MKQCPNCRCQVDVQAVSCPYCGIALPMYRRNGTNQTRTIRSTSDGGKTPPHREPKPRTARNDRYLHRDHQLIILLLMANLVIELAQLLVRLFIL